jgi:hypothetical protein
VSRIAKNKGAVTPVQVGQSPAKVVKRVNFLVSEDTYSELIGLAKRSNRSLTELIKLGLGLVRLALDAQRNGQRLVVLAADGQPHREIVLPPS